ncbi:hypothetical protein EWM64_g6765, partial [Hericium alpestre]
MAHVSILRFSQVYLPAVIVNLPCFHSARFLACQLRGILSDRPLTSCPPGTLYVSANDTRTHFTTVQAAVSSLADDGSATILIGAGEYHETVNVTRRGPLTLL